MTYLPRFAGDIPALYDRHLGPVIFEPYARDLAARVPASARRVLEVAAGTGRVTRQLLAKLPADATLVATDLSEPMLAEAQRQTAPDARVTWQPADMQALPFADASFDVVVVQFGLMFAPDKELAVHELRRVLVPGGTLLLSVWDDLANNPASRRLHELAFALLPADPPVFMRTPFSMGDAAALRALFEPVFDRVTVETVAREGVSESAAHMAVGFVRGNPLYNQLVERGIDAAKFEETVAAALREQFGDAPCRSPISAHVVTAIA